MGVKKRRRVEDGANVKMLNGSEKRHEHKNEEGESRAERRKKIKRRKKNVEEMRSIRMRRSIAEEKYESKEGGGGIQKGGKEVRKRSVRLRKRRKR